MKYSPRVHLTGVLLSIARVHPTHALLTLLRASKGWLAGSCLGGQLRHRVAQQCASRPGKAGLRLPSCGRAGRHDRPHPGAPPLVSPTTPLPQTPPPRLRLCPGPARRRDRGRGSRRGLRPRARALPCRRVPLAALPPARAAALQAAWRPCWGRRWRRPRAGALRVPGTAVPLGVARWLQTRLRSAQGPQLLPPAQAMECELSMLWDTSGGQDSLSMQAPVG